MQVYGVFINASVPATQQVRKYVWTLTNDIESATLFEYVQNSVCKMLVNLFKFLTLSQTKQNVLAISPCITIIGTSIPSQLTAIFCSICSLVDLRFETIASRVSRIFIRQI